MSRKKLVPVDPELQPPIRTFIAECKKAGLAGNTSRRIVNKVINKKRHLSAETEAKKSNGKRRPTSTTTPNRFSTIDPIPELSNKMSTVAMNSEKTENKDPMVVAIEGMEVRLKASMKENRNEEITEMENRLKLNMKEVIESSIQRAIDTMGNTIHQMIANNPTVHSTSSEVSILKEENQRLKQELQHLSAEQGKLENRMERMENRHLENCVIIRGIREEYRETDEAGRIKIYSELSNLFTEESDEDRYNMARRLVIRRCKRLGRFNRDRQRPFSVEFVHHEDVSFIMENRSYLSEGVFVNREFSAEVERKRRTMLPILRAARYIEGYKKQIRLEKDKVVIKGKDYDMGNIHDLPEDLNAFKVTSKENESVVGYFGELNPLSNFFPAPFNLNGVKYISSEQYIQASKANYFSDTDAYNQIMGCKTSVDCKELSRKIKGVDQSKWDSNAADVCRMGIREKFVQNPILLEILVTRTGNKRIVECSKDRLWGTGTPLAQNDSLDPDRWITPGIMGKLLEDIRLEFASQFNQVPLTGVPNSPNRAEQFSTTNTAEPLHVAISSSGMSNDTPGNLRPSMFNTLGVPTSDESVQSVQPSTNEEDMEETVPPN